LKKAHRYFPEIERQLALHNIPDDMKYLCVAESGLDHVVSPAGAAGFWQFMRTTGKEYGMEVNDNVDERYHLDLSLIAATKYLHTAYKRFGTWSLAAAAYNMGMAGLQKQIVEQNIDSYWDLHLNSETARYVYRIIALKIVMENPEKYGFHISEDNLYKELETTDLIVDTTINNLAEFALTHGTNYKMLRHFNPWIRGNSLPNRSGKEYIIKLPAEGVREYKK
jgi:membrane-bound lytic murein transglycosylase D